MTNLIAAIDKEIAEFEEYDCAVIGMTSLQALRIALVALERYEPYCVPMWQSSTDPEFDEMTEVWLARQAITEISNLLDVKL